jgi:hypothetical protein
VTLYKNRQNYLAALKAESHAKRFKEKLAQPQPSFSPKTLRKSRLLFSEKRQSLKTLPKQAHDRLLLQGEEYEQRRSLRQQALHSSSPKPPFQPSL